ncbi:phospholipid-transporting ATPase ABCA3-like [Rhipicephalus sanguineus]|uniref:phospholipid-transporting ATPase ABCA3-like n=1 Tax=Rhipicephalus sanguineus TaxID=34632 RepID=UPI0020C22120|nr:phospholipid-transporting ATPase ABCA3-like [Rhipicephalus sanguineus]
MSLMRALHVVKRRLWLQTVRRHYVAIVLEFLCVAAMSRLLLPPYKPDMNGYDLSARPEAIVYGAFEAKKQIVDVRAVVYKPQNSEADDLIKKSFAQDNRGWEPKVTALMKGPEVESKCRAEWTKYGTHDFMLAEQARIDSNFLEKAKGSQDDQQRLNGLPLSAFWLGHFLAAFIIQMFESLIIVATMYIVGNHSYFKDTYYRHTDVSLVLFVMILFNTGHILLAMIVAAVCKAGNRATFGAVFVAFFVPLFVFPEEPPSLSGLVFQDRWTKLKCAIAPQYGCSILLRTLAIFDDYEDGAGWGSIFKHALNYDSVFELFAVMMLTCLVEVFLLFYLSNVLPWATAYPQSPLFIFMPSYWMPAKGHPNAEDSAQKQDPERFEAPPHLAAAVDIRGLTVKFGSFTALDKVSFKIYSTEVTALLGHNGAGKTTLMSTITGLLKPTSGVVEFLGGEGDAHSNSTGFCQQFDVVFPDLTVREHLVYFGQLRCVDGKELNKSIDETLEAVKLTDKADSFPPQLSGGMKRRLSMSIALVARPKVHAVGGCDSAARGF